MRWTALALMGGWLACTGVAQSAVNEPAPSRVPPFTGILDPASLHEAAPRLRDLQTRRVALLYSANTVKHTAWSNARSKGMDAVEKALYPELHNQIAGDALNQRYARVYAMAPRLEALVEPLKRKSRSVTQIDNRQAFIDGPYDVLAVLDVSFPDRTRSLLVPLVCNCRLGMQVTVYLIDRDGWVTTVEAQQIEEYAVPGVRIGNIEQVRDGVTNTFRAALDDLLVGPELPPPEPAPPPPERRNMLSLAEQLQQIEDDRAAGRISVEEAQIRRNRALGPR